MAACTICKEPGVRKVVDGYLEDNMTGAGISRALGRLFPGSSSVPSSDVINRHRQHYKPEPTRAPRERKRDFAAYMRDRIQTAVEQIEPVTAEDGSVVDPILRVDLQPALNTGLKAQAVLDKREQVAKKQTQAEVLLGLLAALRGEGRPVAQLEDGMTIEGTAREVV